MSTTPKPQMSPTQALGLFTQIVEQTRLLPKEYRQLEEAQKVLLMLVLKKDKAQPPKTPPTAPTEPVPPAPPAEPAPTEENHNENLEN